MIFFIIKNKLKNKATSNIEIQKVLGSIGLDKVGIYLRDNPFSIVIGFVILHPSKGTHWVVYLNEIYFDSYGCSPNPKISKLFIQREDPCLYSEYKIQGLTNKRDFYCATFCLYTLPDKSYRNFIWICCFEVVLPKNSLTINDFEKNNFW